MTHAHRLHSHQRLRNCSNEKWSFQYFPWEVHWGLWILLFCCFRILNAGPTAGGLVQSQANSLPSGRSPRPRISLAGVVTRPQAPSSTVPMCTSWHFMALHGTSWHFMSMRVTRGFQWFQCVSVLKSLASAANCHEMNCRLKNIKDWKNLCKEETLTEECTEAYRSREI